MTPQDVRKALEQVSRLPRQQEHPESDDRLLSRRNFLRYVGLVAAATALIQVPGWLSDRGWIEAAQAAVHDLVHDTLNGLVAFVVPGPDAHSVHQGLSTPEPGGIDANITDALIQTLDGSAPFFPVPFSAVVVSILNDVAQLFSPPPDPMFPSSFARLSFLQKVQVFAIMEGIDPLKPLAGVLPSVVAFLSYSEAGVFEPVMRTLTGQPVGWTISNYGGVADGRDDFQGYFQNRRRVEG